MLKIEYPCRDILSSYKNPNKPITTWAEAKKHLHDVRLRRQSQLASNIDECHKLRTIHKQIFNRQFDSNTTEKPFIPSTDYNRDKSTTTIRYESSSHTNKYSIPRIEYAPVIYRQAIPRFEVENLDKLENDLPIAKELTQYLSESSCESSNNQTENNQSLSTIKKDRQRCLSVSSVSSIDKRANKVHEKWPDYSEISQIVGYRIDPPPSKIITPNTTSSRPSGAMGQRKRNTTTGVTTISKQIKNVISLSKSIIRPEVLKTKKTTKTDIIPIIIDKPTSTNEKVFTDTSIKEIKTKLPTILCPSSAIYSSRIQTRQWLMKNNFSSNAIRTLPLY